MTGAHRAPDASAHERSHTSDLDQVVRLRPGRPDPFRAPGVPDRLVLVLHREGLDYVGTLSTWEYHAIEVTRRDGPEGTAQTLIEMVVDTSTPRSCGLVVHMSRRPTAASVVAELVEVMRRMVPSLIGRDGGRRPRPAEHR